jgi:hypothetical protein
MEQHMQALQRASFVRLARAELKRAVKAREVLVGEILLTEIPDWLGSMRLEELCNAIPGSTWRHFQRAMQETHTKLSATLGGLTPRKREMLGELLASWEAVGEMPRKQRRAYQRRGLFGSGVPRRRTA